MARVVIAPDSFKGSISAAAAAAALADGWSSVRPRDELELRPMADGGEGTLDAFQAAEPRAERMSIEVTGPAGSPIAASWLRLPPSADARCGTGVVELATTSGIELLQGRLRPADADTTGFGQAIRAALEGGVSRLVLGIGSSASTDGGIGLLSALGARFLGAGGRPIRPGLAGLTELASVHLARLLPRPSGGVTVLSDVTIPLVGERGAAAVFGPQKGMSASQIALADAGLRRWASLVQADPDSPGAGAAGGAGFGLMVWGAHLAAGAPEVSRVIGLPETVRRADIVITGEGAFDVQSSAGKVPLHVASVARSVGARCVLVAGRIDRAADLSPFTSTLALGEVAGSASAAMKDPAQWLRKAGGILASSRQLA